MFQPTTNTSSNADQRYWVDNMYLEMPVYTQRGPLLKNHLDTIYRTLGNALQNSPRSYVARFDLRIPADIDNDDTEVISRFVRALRKLLDDADAEKIKQGKRVHSHNLRFCWVREWSNDNRPHYHFALMLNHDRYRTLGSFEAVEGNLAARIKLAWATALKQPLEDSARQVFFAKNGEYRLISKSPNFNEDFGSLFYRLSYMAKAETKQFGTGQHSIGSSRNI